MERVRLGSRLSLGLHAGGKERRGESTCGTNTRQAEGVSRKAVDLQVVIYSVENNLINK